MSFSTEIFIFAFFPAVLLLYAVCKNIRLRNTVLLLSSFLFYSWGGVQYCILMLAAIIVNYFWGMRIKGRKKVLFLAVICNVGILAVFKYMDFFCEIVNGLFGRTEDNLLISSPNLIQPIGISFFTFSILSYLVDVFYGRVDAQKNVFDLGLYILLFPKIMSGPIVRYTDVGSELKDRVFNIGQFYVGLRRFCVGFAKKVLLANQMARLADTIFDYEWGLHPIFAWLGAFVYALNIYLDFSAYSDMAIGIAHIFGFHFKENFNYPYISTSIQEFWRRWHISLSSWFRDYVYIPLGGNRKGKGRMYLNQMIVFFSDGTVARCQLEFYSMGNILWLLSYD